MSIRLMWWFFRHVLFTIPLFSFFSLNEWMNQTKDVVAYQVDSNELWMFNKRHQRKSRSSMVRPNFENCHHWNGNRFDRSASNWLCWNQLPGTQISSKIKMKHKQATQLFFAEWAVFAIWNVRFVPVFIFGNWLVFVEVEILFLL